MHRPARISIILGVGSGDCNQGHFTSPLPSTDSAAVVGPALFACFCGTMGPSDSPETCMLGIWSKTFPNRPPPVASPESPGFRKVSVCPCAGSGTPWRRRSARVSLYATSVWPSPCQDRVGTLKVIHRKTKRAKLIGWPGLPPVNASPVSSRKLEHDSGPGAESVRSPLIRAALSSATLLRLSPALSPTPFPLQ